MCMMSGGKEETLNRSRLKGLWLRGIYVWSRFPDLTYVLGIYVPADELDECKTSDPSHGISQRGHSASGRREVIEASLDSG